MEPIAVAAALLRAQVPDLALRPGATVLARVASRGEHHGVLVLAGIPLTAQLPEAVAAGETLRLRVQEVTAERVTLRLDPEAPGAPVTPGPPPAPAPGPAPPPPGLVVQEPPRRRASAQGEPLHAVALAFTSLPMGRLDLRLELQGGRLRVAVAADAGPRHAAAAAEAERLRARLEAATGLDAAVDVAPRRDPLDVYA